MSGKPKSALEAMNEALTVLKERDRGSNAPTIQDKRQRQALARMCRDKVDSAKAGSTQSAREILEDFFRVVSQHSKRSWCGPTHYIYARFLAEAFQRILEQGEDPAIALGIKSSVPGRRKGVVTNKPQDLAAAYWLLHRKGLRPEKCIALLCELTGVDRTTVQSARRAPYTKAFARPDLVNDGALKQKLRKWRYVKDLLALLRDQKLAK